ncbi:hypothetical protein FRC09_019651 [Ceratobasidium sp. 395]|nr:hypothetical protein FRC09_019651 [Ceratobasidium sp. 395]
MKLGDFVTWIAVDGVPQTEYKPEAGDAPLRLDNGQPAERQLKGVAHKIVRSPQQDRNQAVAGSFWFGLQNTTDSDELADPNDQKVATIRLEFEWVKPCSKTQRGRARRSRCSECEANEEEPDPRPRRSKRFQLGLVHENAKKSHGIAATSSRYFDSDRTDRRLHSTDRIRTLFEYKYGPRHWLEEMGVVDPEIHVIKEESPAAEQRRRPTPAPGFMEIDENRNSEIPEARIDNPRRRVDLPDRHRGHSGPLDNLASKFEELAQKVDRMGDGIDRLVHALGGRSNDD